MIDIKEQLKEIAFSEETYTKMVSVGDKYNLTLDSQGYLSAETRDVIMGFKQAKDFSKNIQERMEIDSITASKITTDINATIFIPLREQLRTLSGTNDNSTPKQPTSTPITQPKAPAPTPQIPKIQFQPLPTIQTPYKNPITNTASQNPIKPSLEQAGRFTIEKPPVGMPQYKEREINKENVLKGIEDPTISMVDHLLTTPVNTVSGIEVKKPVEKVVVEKKPYTTDPYREQI